MSAHLRKQQGGNGNGGDHDEDDEQGRALNFESQHQEGGSGSGGDGSMVVLFPCKPKLSEADVAAIEGTEEYVQFVETKGAVLERALGE
jgi:hypothetical protein